MDLVIKILFVISVLVMLVLMVIVGYLVKRSLNRASEKEALDPKNLVTSTSTNESSEGGDSADVDRRACCSAEENIAEALAYLIRHVIPGASVSTGYYEETVDVPGWDVSVDHNGKSYIIFVNKLTGVRIYVQYSDEDYKEVEVKSGGDSDVPLKLQKMITDLQQPAQVAESVAEEKDGVGL